jgi:signal transduction histidine kinase
MKLRPLGFLTKSKLIKDASRLLAPTALGVVLMVLLLHVMNFGGRRESLAARAESALIRAALVYQSMFNRPSQESSPVVVITAIDDDRPAIELAAHPLLHDASLKEYASVLEKIAVHKPRWVVLSWLTYAHPTSPEHLKPITEVIDRLKLRDRVTIAINLYAAETMSQEFMRTYNIVEARDCYYDVNLFCTVLPEWGWMPQQVINRFMHTDRPWVISKNLPHVLPNILLNLPQSKHLTRYQFLDFRPPVTSRIPNGAVVFIGNAMTQHFGFRDNKDAIQKTFVATSDATSTLMTDGVPWHVFWAQLASMLMENQFISVLPSVIGWYLIAVLGGAVIVGLFVSRRWTLWGLVGVGGGVACVNLVTLPLFSLYVPVMPLAMAVVVLLIGAMFTAVAHSSYAKWRIQAQTEISAATADIKQNFIHLISHNLNTPIAQLRGILELLVVSHPNDGGLDRAVSIMEWMRVTVGSVLNAVTKEHQSIHLEETSFRVLIQDFIESESGFFRRLGLEVAVTPLESDDEHGEIWFYRFRLDCEMTKLCLLYSVCKTILEHRCRQVIVRCRPVNPEPADPQGLIVSFHSQPDHSMELAVEPEFPLQAMKAFLQVAESRGIVTLSESDEVMSLLFQYKEER